MDKKNNQVKGIPIELPSPSAGLNANGWNEYSRLVLNELERLNVVCNKLEVGIVEIKVEIAKLQIKSGVWGLAGGAISVLVTVLFLLLKGGLIGN